MRDYQEQRLDDDCGRLHEEMDDERELTPEEADYWLYMQALHDANEQMERALEELGGLRK
jgi:hypothetical protein